MPNKKTELDAAPDPLFFNMQGDMEPSKKDLELESYQDVAESLEQDDSFEDDYESVDYYTDILRNNTILTEGEEHALGVKVKYGTPEERKHAIDELVIHNFRYVMQIAVRFKGSGLDYDDIVQNGCLGLYRAAERYNIDKGYRFTTYATWWIRQGIMRGISNDARTIRIPVHMYEKIQKLKHAESKFYQSTSTDATEFLTEELGITPEKLWVLKNLKGDVVSLDTPVSRDGESKYENTLIDFVPDEHTMTPEEIYVERDLKKEMGIVMECLTEREREVINYRYGLRDARPRTLEEIGVIFGVTRERIRQIEAKALRKMRHSHARTHITEYL